MQPSAREIAARAATVIDEHIGLEGAMLPILHALQAEFGYVPHETLPLVADALNISRAEAHGVVTFYHDYRAHPAGRHVLKLCRAEACQAMDGERAGRALIQSLGAGFHETAADGSVTVEPVFCLGLCACAPAAMLDGEVFGRIGDDEVAAEIVEAVRA